MALNASFKKLSFLETQRLNRNCVLEKASYWGGGGGGCGQDDLGMDSGCFTSISFLTQAYPGFTDMCKYYQPTKPFENQTTGTSLVAPWLRIRLPMQGTRVRSLVQEDPTRRGATEPVRHNY